MPRSQPAQAEHVGGVRTRVAVTFLISRLSLAIGCFVSDLPETPTPTPLPDSLLLFSPIVFSLLQVSVAQLRRDDLTDGQQTMSSLFSDRFQVRWGKLHDALSLIKSGRPRRMCALSINLGAVKAEVVTGSSVG